MKSTGVIRRIDELGRIVIPKEIRRNLGIRDGENIEIFTDNDSIILKKYYRMSTNSELAQLLCTLVYDTFNYKIFITDREKAVRTAIEHASGSDVVILAGNGDAKHQRVNGKLVYYPSDLAIAKEYATY